MRKLAISLAAGVLVLAACGGGADTAGNNVAKTCDPTDGALALKAKDTKFDKDCLAVKAGAAFTVAVQNDDADQHNFSIYKSKGGSALFKGTEFADGGKTVTYQVGALDAGKFYFQCDVHPEMNGPFIVV